MTADGTYRPARAGETITNPNLPDKLDALPIGTIVRDPADGYVWEQQGDGWWAFPGSSLRWDRDQVAMHAGPRGLTVLFRPDSATYRAACGCDLSAGPNALHILDHDPESNAPTAHGEITASELNGLPDGSVVLDRHAEAWQMVAHDPSNPETAWAPMMFGIHDEIDEPLLASELTEHAPLTVLFRPDAPQPATTDDAVERAAREYVHRQHNPTHDRGVGIAQGAHYRAGFVDGAVWQHQQAPALAAAGAGAEVDREALATVGRMVDATIEHSDVMTRADLLSALDSLSATIDTLAARGDAPAPVVDREALAADKNGEGCPLCESTDDLCAYHRGYDDGWAKGRAFALVARGDAATPTVTTDGRCPSVHPTGRRCRLDAGHPAAVDHAWFDVRWPVGIEVTP